MNRKKLAIIIFLSGMIVTFSVHYYSKAIIVDEKASYVDLYQEIEVDRVSDVKAVNNGPDQQQTTLEVSNSDHQESDKEADEDQPRVIADIQIKPTTITTSSQELCNETPIENQMSEAFNQLLLPSNEVFQLIPEGTHLNKVIVVDGDLLLDFSEELLEYGGTLWEDELIHLLLSTAFSNESIKSVTITINEQTENFVEGTTINGYTRENWNERKYEDVD